MSYAWCVLTHYMRKLREGVCDDEDTSCASTPPTIDHVLLYMHAMLQENLGVLHACMYM
jgi:hypothetical protein